MDKKFVAKMNERLVSLKAQIIQSLISENEDFEALIHDMDPKDLADIAADDIDRKTLAAVSNQDVKRLRQIDGALSRINNEKYGTCPSCGKKIEEQRLEAIPYALLCINCKTVDERKRR